MPLRDARTDWQALTPEAIPTKTNLDSLEIFLNEITARFGKEGPPLILDAGCGVGVVSRYIHAKGFSVIGVDINASAIKKAREFKAPSKELPARPIDFIHGDINGLASQTIPTEAFSGVVCQLLISIVGTEDDRAALLASSFLALRPGGYLYLSASGVSNDINPMYAQAYESDRPLTKEPYTYLSRDQEGRALYATHHFSEEELERLMRQAGFVDIHIDMKMETSSRRKNQSAYFYYCSCHKPGNAHEF